jgi:hypothetical protein
MQRHPQPASPSLSLPPSLGLRDGQSPGPVNVSHTPNKERTRTKAKDYPEHQALILAATRPYYVKVWTCGPFPDEKLQAQWAVDSWGAVSDGVPVPDPRVIRYVSHSRYRRNDY